MMSAVLNRKPVLILWRGWIFTSSISIIVVGLIEMMGMDAVVVVVADSSKPPMNVTFLHPKVRMLGDDAAVITYGRIVQSMMR